MRRAAMVGMFGPACGVTCTRTAGMVVVVDAGWLIIARAHIEIMFLIAGICPKLGTALQWHDPK